jgi:GR25 family glycosyltransferase involved in LPS biosynthesis
MEIVSTLLTEYNINYKRISGVYLKDKYTDALNLNTKTSGLGHLGCILSHLKCLQDSKDNNYEKILIFEDDIKFLKDYINEINFEELTDEIKNINWDLFYLGATFNNKLIKTTKHLDIPSGQVWATQSIGYNSNMRDKILQTISQDVEYYMRGNRFQKLRPIDVIYDLNFKNKNRIAINPIVCIQNETQSDIVPSALHLNNSEYQLSRWLVNRS